MQVSGHVQGVGFRYFVHQQATKLGLSGYVKNQINGDVEIVAQGDSAQVTTLINWLENGGITSARISAIAITKLPQQEELASFTIRY